MYTTLIPSAMVVPYAPRQFLVVDVEFPSIESEQDCYVAEDSDDEDDG